jgi:HTH-type transcriptional regulator/antitoxin HigA
MSDDALKFKPNYTSPPGNTLRNVLEELSMTPDELAERLGMSREAMSRLLAGELALTDDIADALERELGTLASFWRRREGLYRRGVMNLKAERRG